MNVDDTSRKTRTRFRESWYTQEECSTLRDKAANGRIATRVYPEALLLGDVKVTTANRAKAEDDATNLF